MNILFVHQNFPAQFGALAEYLAREGWEVSYATAQKQARSRNGVRIIPLSPHRDPAEGVHRFALPMERAMINAQAFANSAIRARDAGLKPDVVVAHSGWGSGTFAKAVWPDCAFVAYLEWYYQWPPTDQIGTPKKKMLEDARAQALARNAPMLLDMAAADKMICPTQFQADQFPERYRDDLTILHDGIDTLRHAPNPGATPPLPEGVTLPPDAEIVTYATRGMEPHRGFPEFMRALERLQKQRPRLHAIIAGQDRVCYGGKLAEGDSWKTRMLKDLDLDESRIHFTGSLPRKDYLRLLQASHVHTYLTVPFVLSWSLIEAMSTGCSLVASDVAPVREALLDGHSARLVDHGNIDQLATNISDLLEDRTEARALGAQARATAQQRYDAKRLMQVHKKLFSQLRPGQHKQPV